MDKLGGKNVTYLTDVESINTKFSELNLESIINLFRKVAFGLVFLKFYFINNLMTEYIFEITA